MRPKRRPANTRAAPLMLGAACCVAATFPTIASEEAEHLLEAEHLTTQILSLTGDTAYGEYLGGECVTCHQLSGASNGIPPIVGLPIDYTVQALVEYKLGIRTNDVMQLRAARLADDEIAALAAYFSQLEAK